MSETTATQDPPDAPTVPTQPPRRPVANLAATGAPPNLSDPVNYVRSIDAQRAAATQKYVQSVDQNQKQVQDLIAQEKARPEIGDTPAPKVPQSDPWETFASPAMVLAQIASAFTHTPAIAGMNAAAAAINAKNQGDWKTYDAEYKKWKDNTDLALKREAEHRAKWNEVMELMKTSMAEGTAAWKAVDAMYGDQVSHTLQLSNLLVERERLAQGRERLSMEMAEAKDKIAMDHPRVVASLALSDAMKTGDRQKIADASMALARIEKPEEFLAADNEAKARGLAADPANYKDGKLTDDAFQKMMTFDPKLAMDVRKSGIEKAYAPTTYKLPDGSDITAIVSPDGTAREVGTGRVVNLAGAVKASAPKPETVTQGKEEDARTLAKAKFNELHGHDPTPQDEPEMAKLRMTTRMDANGVISDDAADFVAGRLLAGDERATVGMARSAANMTKVSDRILKVAKEQSLSPNDVAIRIAEFQGTLAGERTLGTRAANMEIAANVVRRMAPVAADASAKVDRTEFPTLNSVILAADRGTGGENVVRFGQAANAIIYEYSKFLNPTGIPTDADKARATDILNTAWSRGQFAAALDQIVNKEIPSGAAGIRDTRQEFRGGLGTATTATEGQAHPDSLPDGTMVIQDGVKYRRQNGQWVLVQ